SSLGALLAPVLTAAVLALAGLPLVGCAPAEQDAASAPAEEGTSETVSPMQAKVDQYTELRLESDLASLTDAERQMIPLLIEAAQAMDEAFWIQAYGDKDALLASIDDPATRRFAEINYGPWDRLDDNTPFVEGVGSKPAGANFYPRELSREALQTVAKENPSILDPYTMVVADEIGNPRAVPYHEAFAELYSAAAAKLREAAKLAEDPGLQTYLTLRADALETSEYQESDLAWMDMKTNTLDIVIGPVENYEDKLFGQKTASTAYVLVKDRQWSDRLAKYATMLPALQKGLPVPDAYKQEAPGSDSDLGAYDVIYYAGDCNAGAKTIAINLPNDE
ncbi:MAG: hypothetical protein MI919_08525, partial [Holophagales bacterium]|nr:hypothetical protein [Holophagales bacterium]